MKLSERQNEFRLNLEQKKYAGQLLESFGLDKCKKYLGEERDYFVSTDRYLHAKLYNELIEYIKLLDKGEIENIEELFFSGE